LVLELAIDDLGLMANTGALNPMDVLVIGSQDGLQLLLEGVRHSDVIIFFYLLNKKYSPEVHLDPSFCMTTPMKVEEYP
jgi:hypothetical protein